MAGSIGLSLDAASWQFRLRHGRRTRIGIVLDRPPGTALQLANQPGEVCAIVGGLVRVAVEGLAGGIVGGLVRGVIDRLAGGIVGGLIRGVIDRLVSRNVPGLVRVIGEGLAGGIVGGLIRVAVDWLVGRGVGTAVGAAIRCLVRSGRGHDVHGGESGFPDGAVAERRKVAWLSAGGRQTKLELL